MIITRHGSQFLKLAFGDTTIAVNPVSKDSKQKAVRFGADICLISINDPDWNGREQVSFGDKEAFVISGPGEYEKNNIFIKGFPSVSHYGGDRINTIYTFTFDSLNLCILGATDVAELSAEAKESLEEIDILFVPIGGSGTLDAHAAYALAVKLEPKIIIPLGYDDARDSLKTFLKEGGSEGIKGVDKLTLKKKDLEGKDGEMIVLDES